MKMIQIYTLALLISNSIWASERPADCPPQYAACLTRVETERIAIQQVELERLRVLRKISTRRFGWSLGPGLGVGIVVDEDFNTEWVPTAGGFLVWGLRF